MTDKYWLPIPWTHEELEVAEEALDKYPADSNLAIARKIENHPVLARRTFGAIEQKLGEMKRSRK